MALARRSILKGGLALATLGAVAPAFVVRTAAAAAQPAAGPRDGLAPSQVAANRLLVVVQLAGGNDGLNTVVPYADPAYRRLRPNLGLTGSDLLPLNGELALHGGLAPLKAFFEAGKLGIVQGVQYPNPNRSHFASIAIWQTADLRGQDPTGWLGRYTDQHGGGNAFHTVGALNSLPRTLWTSVAPVPAIGNAAGFRYQTGARTGAVRAAELTAFRTLLNESTTVSGGALEAYARSVFATAVDSSEQVQAIVPSIPKLAGSGPENELTRGLGLISALDAAGLGTRVGYVQLGGFDTHANQKNAHQNLLSRLAQGLDAFVNELERRGRFKDVLIMTFSEFGRRPKENGSGGTDHGTALPMFLLGGGVKGGLLTPHPSLTDLDELGDLRFGLDFRNVYAAVLRDWLGVDPAPIVGPEFTGFSLV